MTEELRPKTEIINTHPLLAHRLAAAANGWSQAPSQRKAGCFGWTGIANDAQAIRTGKWWRDELQTGTSLRIEGNLCVLDLDVTIRTIVDEILDLIHSLDPDAYEGAIIRNSGGESVALFYRCRVAFGHFKTRSYTAHPEHLPALEAARAMPEATREEAEAKRDAIVTALTALDPQKFEMFGPDSKGRHFVYEGEHSPGRFYECENDRWPWNTRLDDVSLLPALYDAKGKHGEICDMVEAILAAHMTVIPAPPRPDGDVVYDLTPDMLYFPKDGGCDTIENLMAGRTAGADHGLRGCLPSTIVSKSGQNCKLFVEPGSGRVTVTDWANDGLKHYMAGDKPSDAEITDEDRARIAALKQQVEEHGKPRKVEFGDLVGHAPSGKFMHRTTSEMWPVGSVDKTLPKVTVGYTEKDKPIQILPSTWLMQNSMVHQITWMPGAPEFLVDTLVYAGGMAPQRGNRVYNLYRGPRAALGDAAKAGPWLDHVHMVFSEPGDAVHIIRYFACCLQYPGLKINHGLLLCGLPGIGKDTVVSPLRFGLGTWNVAEISPNVLFKEFNEYHRTVLLRVNELHDLGNEANMYTLYERLKAVLAAPPETVRINDKNIPAHYIPNICKVVMTTNHPESGVYLPAECRRTHVSRSPLTEPPSPDYFEWLYAWMADDGNRHVAAYLRELDISTFDAAAPPVKTAAFWAIVNANRSTGESSLGDVLIRMGEPEIVTTGDLEDGASNANEHELREWLRDPKHRRHIPSTLNRLGYTVIPNPGAKDGRWLMKQRKQTVYRSVKLAVERALDLVNARITDEAKAAERSRNKIIDIRQGKKPQ